MWAGTVILHRHKLQCSLQPPATSAPNERCCLYRDVFCSISSCFCVPSKLEAFCDVSLNDHFVILERLYNNLGVCFNFILLKFYCILLNCFCFIVNETKSSLCNSLQSKIIKEQRWNLHVKSSFLLFSLSSNSSFGFVQSYKPAVPCRQKH